MADLQFGRDVCGAFLFTEEKNFRTRIKFGPAGDGVALNYANVPVERLGHSEQGKQGCSLAADAGLRITAG
jgi:hypothetical protein